MSERINLAEIEARYKAATAGPWTWDHRCLLNEELDRMIVVHDSRYAWEADDDDQKFIAHARTDLPALIAWVKEAQAALIIARSDRHADLRALGYEWGEDFSISRYDALLSRLEVERP